MKYTAITDGGKYGVQPTMSKPNLDYSGADFYYRDEWIEWEEHLKSRPRYLRTQGLELLPDGEEFEAEIGYQFSVTENGRDGWVNITKENYEQLLESPDCEDSIRQVLAPLVKDETEYLLSGNNGERLKESIGQLSTPEPVEQEGEDEILGIAMSVARRVGELYGLDKSKNKLIGFLDGFHEGYKHRHIQVEALEELLAASKAPLKQSDAVEAKKVCYCGSLRVALDEFKKKEYEAVLRGEIALLPCCMFVDIQREYGAESDYKQKADELHKRKIDICDEVFVLNVGGYIGESTRSEIDYAVKIGKPIKYLEPL